MSLKSAKKNWRSRLRRAFRALALLFLLVLLVLGGIWLAIRPDCERTNGIVYGHRGTHDLTFDLVQPAAPNGLGVIFVVSSAWKSWPITFDVRVAAPLLRSGYTVFAVSHVSQPEASMQEIVEDVNRAVRFIRYHAAEYEIDPGRLGVTGGSSGGHLSLMLATRGGPGPQDAPDPVDRVSSAVQAAAVFFPVANLFGVVGSPENVPGGRPRKGLREAFGPGGAGPETWQAIGRELSPIFHVNPAQPPVLSIHGDADPLVPITQSFSFQDASAEAGAPEVEVVVREGKRHGWLTIPRDVRLLAQWFDTHLKLEKLE